MRHRSFSSSWTHLIPAGLPVGMPGIGEEMDGAVQHAPHRSRQFIGLYAMHSAGLPATGRIVAAM